MDDMAAKAAWLLDQIAAERLVATAISDASKVQAECDVKERIVELWKEADKEFQNEGTIWAKVEADTYANIIELHVDAYKRMGKSGYFSDFKRRPPK